MSGRPYKCLAHRDHLFRDGFCVRCSKQKQQRHVHTFPDGTSVVIPKKPERFFLERTNARWKYVRCKVRAWGLDLPDRYERLRCDIAGNIEVWREGFWLGDEFHQLSYRQSQRIHRRLWPTPENYQVFQSLSQVPMLHLGKRFWIKGTPEQDGLWKVAGFAEGKMRLWRLLPDYTDTPSIPWENDDALLGRQESEQTCEQGSNGE